MRANNLKAIGIMLLGVAVFSFMDAGLKQLSTFYAPLQITFLRSAASLPFLVVWVAWSRAGLRPSNIAMYVVRALVGILMLTSFIYAVSTQGLADTYAIFMSAPLLVAALSRVVLHERVSWRRWLAIGVGMVGVVVALKPHATGLLSLGGIAAAISACCYAVSALMIRMMGRQDSSQALVVWYLVLTTVFSFVLAFSGWHPIVQAHWPLIVLVGATGALGQFLFTSAFRLASPSVVAPFEYTAMLWGLTLDFILFAITPAPRVLLGGSIVIAGGLYLLWDERRSAAAARAVHG